MKKDAVIKNQDTKIEKLEFEVEKQKNKISEQSKKLRRLKSIRDDLLAITDKYVKDLKNQKSSKRKYSNKYFELLNTDDDFKRIIIKTKRLSKIND